MLKLFTDAHFLTETYRGQVFPLLFDLVFKPSKVLSDKFMLTDLVEEADIIVFPVNYTLFLKHQTEFSRLISLAKKYSKPIWIYSAGDYGFTNYIPNSYTFRLGGFDSQMNDKTFILPSFINDPYQNYLPQGFSILKKKTVPSIGFVGHAQSGILKYLKEVLNHLKYQMKRKFNIILADKQSFYPSSIKRVHYLKKLNLNNSLNTNFILRKSYRAGVQTKSDKLKTTQEFYDNLFDNAYTFCVRGVGNFSVRFYETLAVGRIPILLNTDCRLPLLNVINWTKHCLILNEKSKISLAEQILNFHNSLSPEDFESIQLSNRDLWLNYLCREAYFLEIYKQFKNSIIK